MKISKSNKNIEDKYLQKELASYDQSTKKRVIWREEYYDYYKDKNGRVILVQVDEDGFTTILKSGTIPEEEIHNALIPKVVNMLSR